MARAVSIVSLMCETDATANEWAALEVVRFVEEVTRHKRLEPSGRGDTADWRVWMADERVADVEVTLITDEHTNSLMAATHNRKWPAAGLSYEWNVWTAFADGPGRDRDFDALVAELEGVLRRVEAEGGDTREILERANELLDPQRYMVPDESWLGDRTLPRSTAHREAFLRANCDYWLVQDIVDWYLTGIDPRRVMAIRCETAGTDGGHIRTFVSTAEGGVVSRVDALVSAAQRCISEKHQQLQGAPDLRWLVVLLDDGLPEMQLQRAFSEDSPFESAAESADGLGHLAQLGDIKFPGIDEVWVVGPSRLGQHLGDYLMVLRMVGTGSNWTRALFKSADVLGTNWYAFLTSPATQRPAP